MRIPAILIITAAALAGCTTPAVRSEFENSAVVQRDQNEVWTDLIEFFTSSNIQIQTIERESGVVYAERSRVDGAFASCDRNDFVEEGARIVRLNVFVRPLAAQRTQVTVNTQFDATGYDTLNSRPVDILCYSTGLLENGVLEAVRR